MCLRLRFRPSRPLRGLRIGLLVALFGAAAPAPAADLACPSARLPSGRILTPVGQSLPIGNFPVRVLPFGDALVVLEGGAGRAQHVELFTQGRQLRRSGGLAASERVAPVSSGTTIAQGKRAPLNRVLTVQYFDSLGFPRLA